MVRMVHQRYERDVAHPVDRAYAWLTDYDDDDAQLAGAIIKDRPVLERHPDRVVLRGDLEAVGRRMRGIAEVRLHPPDHWVAHLKDLKGRTSGVYDYRLEPRPGGSRLIVDYGFVAPKLKHVILFTLGRRRIRRELDLMWDGFFAAMDRDLRAPQG